MGFPDSFATARLRAERLTPEHFSIVFDMHRDPEQMAMLGGIRDEQQTADYLDRNLQHWADHGFGVWILRDAQQGRVAGRALLRHLLLEGEDEVEVGYSFHPAFWGRGLATEIATACVRLGYDALGLRTIVALTMPDNLRSQRVLTKAGLAYERDVSHDELTHMLFRSRIPDTPGADPLRGAGPV
ncbi:MAG TPA: GNAT family N-acetyltransferase [Gemmatimonadales bacterium]|jgi:RimJ/RimL family protein N-acetyltransferase